VHHFLLPAEGWGSAVGAKEAKELAPEALDRLKAWRRSALVKPTKQQVAALVESSRDVGRPRCGRPATNAVYGFISMLITVLRDERPDAVAVAFDVSRETFRNKEYAEYKATRAASPEGFSGQIPLIKEVLAALRIPTVEREGFEADDLIATLTRRGREAGLEVLISSGDRDSFQLITEQVTVLYPGRGVAELQRMTPDAVEAKYGVRPERYPDMAALVGETSDNLPGVPGVGPKTAAKWLISHGDLDGVVAAAPTIRGKAGESLREHLDGVLRNRRLNRLVDDVDLDLDVSDLYRQDWDVEQVHQIFDTLQFRALRERLFSTLGGGESEPTDGIEVEATRMTDGEVATWLQRHTEGVVTGVEVVGQWSRGTGDARGIALAVPDGTAGYIDLVAAGSEAIGVLAGWLADADRLKAMHDAKGPVTALTERGLTVNGFEDTALAAYLCHPERRALDLGDLVQRELGKTLTTESGGQGQLTLDTGDQDEADAAMIRAKAVVDLLSVLERELPERGALSLFREVEMPLVPVLSVMERTGIAVDEQALRELEDHFASVVTRAAEQAYETIGRQVNLGSPKQLQVVLFDQLDMPRTKRTKTGYTTDADALADLYAKTEHPFLLHLLRHRDASKLRQTVEGLLKSVSDDGRIHTTFQQTVAATGRLSSTDPNLQNIPVRTDEGRRIRGTFVVGAGFETLMTADYSQIEMRIMAHLSEDEGLIEAFRSGEDLHRFVGARVFGVPPQEVTSEMRSRIKAMSYGLAYGLSQFGLARQLGITGPEARRLTEDYYARFQGVRDYLDQVMHEARRTGYTETLLGRRRYLPDLASDNRQRREMAERMALNAPIQGSAADIIKVAMLDVDRRLRESGMRSRMLLQVHDELVLEVVPGERDQVAELVTGAMGAAATPSVPLEVSVGTGRTCQEAAH
jgi:DNA polymerase-1